MANVHDVAAYILQKRGTMTTMKLQKLVYYSQAWSLVWEEEPLFPEKIEAWANGPVVRELFERHRGEFKVSKWDGDPNAVTPVQAETIDMVLQYYGKMSSVELSNLTHREPPWREARQGLSTNERGSAEISLESMANYYSSLVEG